MGLRRRGGAMIKNYTSTVPSERSIAHIERRLVEHSARNIMKEYGANGELAGIYFIVQMDGREVPYKLPAKIDRVGEALMKAKRRPRADTRKKVLAQAERTAWKLIADWVDVQMSLIELEQAEFAEVFLPYTYDAGKRETFFERVKAGGYKLLPCGAGGKGGSSCE